LHLKVISSATKGIGLMNNLIYIVGLVVIVLAVLGFLGLR
jgi:small-conductance mechanosensitive channel